jgi:hypothetical protein
MEQGSIVFPITARFRLVFRRKTPVRREVPHPKGGSVRRASWQNSVYQDCRRSAVSGASAARRLFWSQVCFSKCVFFQRGVAEWLLREVNSICSGSHLLWKGTNRFSQLRLCVGQCLRKHLRDASDAVEPFLFNPMLDGAPGFS